MGTQHCPTTLPEKPAYKSKTNWLVNLPLVVVALLASLPDALQDPTVAANNPLGAGKTKIILWGVAILNFYFRNFGKQSTLTLGNRQTGPDQPLTSGPADVILNNDVQSPYKISNEIPPGVSNG